MSPIRRWWCPPTKKEEKKSKKQPNQTVKAVEIEKKEVAHEEACINNFMDNECNLQGYMASVFKDPHVQPEEPIVGTKGLNLGSQKTKSKSSAEVRKENEQKFYRIAENISLTGKQKSAEIYANFFMHKFESAQDSRKLYKNQECTLSSRSALKYADLPSNASLLEKLSTSPPKDIEKICSNYNQMSKTDQYQFWLFFLMNLSADESNCNNLPPSNKHPPNDYVFGYFQLERDLDKRAIRPPSCKLLRPNSCESEKCPITSNNYRDVTFNDQLRCALEILVVQTRDPENRNDPYFSKYYSLGLLNRANADANLVSFFKKQKNDKGLPRDLPTAYFNQLNTNNKLDALTKRFGPCHNELSEAEKKAINKKAGFVNTSP